MEQTENRSKFLARLQIILAQLSSASWNEEGKLIGEVLSIVCDELFRHNVTYQGEHDTLLIELNSIAEMLSSEPDRTNVRSEIKLWVELSK